MGWMASGRGCSRGSRSMPLLLCSRTRSMPGSDPIRSTAAGSVGATSSDRNLPIPRGKRDPVVRQKGTDDVDGDPRTMKTHPSSIDVASPRRRWVSRRGEGMKCARSLLPSLRSHQDVHPFRFRSCAADRRRTSKRVEVVPWALTSLIFRVLSSNPERGSETCQRCPAPVVSQPSIPKRRDRHIETLASHSSARE